ncbi:hypothetical protein HYT84_03010 [Candidatus Micrarchaeota archaeon]|nr:hypothetical protein [Candidatus Micrarchaeota archaeon]
MKIMNWFVLLMLISGLMFAEDVVKNNKLDVYVYKDLNGGGAEARQVGATITMYSIGKSVLDKKTTDSTGIAQFTLPENGMVVYFVATYGNTKYLSPIYGTEEAKFQIYYDSSQNKNCRILNGETDCDLETTTLWPVVQTVQEKNTGKFTIYVYDSNMNKVGNAKVEMFKADGTPYASTYANSNGEVTFNEDNLPDGVQFYFVASKEGKTYESIDGKTLTFADSGNNVDGYCQYKNGVKTQCKVTGYALAKDTTPVVPKTEPVKEPTKVLENKISVYVYDIDADSNSVKVPGATITMYSSNGAVLDAKTSDSTGIAFFTLPTEGSLVYFGASKSGKTFDSYSEKPSEFMLYYDIANNIKCVSKNGNKECTIKVHTLWPNKVEVPAEKVVQPTVSEAPYVVVSVWTKEKGERIPGLTVYMYNFEGNSLIDTKVTDGTGHAKFDLPEGTWVYFLAYKNGDKYKSAPSQSWNMGYLYNTETSQVCYSTIGPATCSGLTTIIYPELFPAKVSGPVKTNDTGLGEEPALALKTNQLAVYVYKSKGEPVGANVVVYMHKYNADGNSEFLESKSTDSKGKVIFTLPNDVSVYFAASDYFVAGKDNSVLYTEDARKNVAEIKWTYRSDKNVLCKIDGSYENCNGGVVGLYPQTSQTKSEKNESPNKPEPKITPDTEIGYSLTLNKGWNLFSVPFTYGRMVSSTCGNDVMFGYNDESKKYYKLSLAGLDLFKSAYWMKAKESCTIDFKLEPGYGWLYSNQINKNLKKGWNIINAPYDRVSLEDIAGNCEFKSGPWYYNTGDKKWAKSQLLESSRGYIVKVAGDCTLGSTDEVPPALPVE